jgi:hypothetical protein
MIPIREIAAIALAGKENGSLAMLRAYLDASKSDAGGNYYVVAGFVAPADTWNEIEQEWRAETALWGLDDFHLADIPYHLGHEKGSLCIRSFANIMQKSGAYGVGIACEVDFWNRQDTGYEHPYHFCFGQVLSVIHEQQLLEKNIDPMALIVDQDFEPNDLAQAVFDAYKNEYPIFKSVTFGHRKEFVPLQCADLAAGALRLQWEKGFLIALHDPLYGVTFLAYNKRRNRVFSSLDNRSEAASFPDMKTAQAFAEQVRATAGGKVVVEAVS